MSLTATIDLPDGKKIEIPTGLFINGEFVRGVENKTFQTINPATEKVICSVHEATPADVDVAVAAARKAFEGGWGRETGFNRGKLMAKLADLMERDNEILAQLESLDNGKGINVARTVDVPMSADCIRYYSGWADKIHGKVIDPDPNHLCYSRVEPIGVVGQIIPWNFPLLMWAWKIGPAVCTGNVVIIKSAEQTPLSALYMAKLIKEAGFPSGVINVLSGYGRTCGAAISAHMDIDKVAFTGSTVVGREIMVAAARSNLKKVTLELGGKSPNIVFKDANIEEAINWVNFGMFFNHGQTCSAGSRIYVQDEIYDEFVRKFKEKVKTNVVGEPHNPDTFQGPQVSQVQYDRVMGYIDSGKSEGAKVEIGGNRFGKIGYYIEPTIFSNVHEDMKIMREEVFGPVCSIARFTTDEDVIAKANKTLYGLAAGIHTTNVNTIAKISAALKAGTVWVNTYNNLHHQLPFGGYKQSGIGKELGEAALAGYTNAKTVTVRLTT